MNTIQVADSSQELINLLYRAPWFQSVGEPIEVTEQISQVKSWGDALQWVRSDLSRWCCFEGSMLLYRHIGKHAPDLFAHWNDIAKLYLPIVEDLLKLIRSVSSDYEFEDDDYLWIQGQITHSILERHYQSVATFSTFQNQIEWYLQGHFPCGWSVKSEEDFPQKSLIIVF